MKKLMAIIGVIALALLSSANAAESSPVPATYIMVCCHGADKGTKFLANGEWDARHDYRNYAFALDQMRKIKEAGINVVGVDFTNPSQWDQFKPHHWPMLQNVVRAAKELDMQYFLFLGNTCAHTMKYWNEKAKIVWEEFAQDPHYRRYGFGDDRPMMTIFLPGKDFAAHLKRSRPEEKNWLEKFRIGTCQVNDPIVPTPTDGWGYRNKSAGSTDLARFVAPNSGVGPGTWARVDANEWRARVKWALGAKEYAVIGTYDDTCDCIFWGIADVRGSRNPTHVHESTKIDPYAYYNIVKEEIAKKRAGAALVSITSGTCAESNPVPQVLWHMEVEVDGVGKPISIESEEQAFEKSQGTFSFGPLKAGERVFYISVTLNVKETPVGKVYTGSVANNEKGTRIVKFNGPKFDCVSVDPARASLYIPKGLGRRMRHFPVGGKGAGGINSFTTIETEIYPYSGLTMPWVALDTGNATYYAAAYDRKARVKSVGARWYSRRRQVDLRFRHPLSIRPGERWEMPEMVFEKVSGDWHDAAKRYRAWYDSTHPAVGSAAPDWTRDMVGLLLVIMRQQNELLMWPYTDIPKLCDVAERNGLDCIGLYGWTVGGHDHLYPDYDPDPKMGGVPALKAGIAEAHRRGIRLYIYANGQLQQVGATKFWDAYGKNFAITRRDGSPYIQTYHKYKDIPIYQFALACLYGAPWRERMFSLACQAESFGADAIIYDQMGAQRPYVCWGRGHGHPTPWSAHAEERPGFLRGIADEIRKRNPSFSVFTEGVYDSILDSIGFSHSWTPGTFKKDALNVAARDEARPSKDGDTFPELFRYTFPESVMTTRFPTPMAPRYMANYAAVFGLRHEIEIRYMPDRAYVLDGKVPTKEDYGTVRSKPDVNEMRATPPATASAYLKAVCDFQKRHAKYLLRGRFVDEEGFTIGRAGSPLPAANALIAKRYVADDGTSAVCVWNISEKPVDVVIGGLGKPKGVYEPGTDHATSAEIPLPPDSLRLYVY